MTQRERVRLVVLKKAIKKLIKQSQAAKELGITARRRRAGDLTRAGPPPRLQDNTE